MVTVARFIFFCPRASEQRVSHTEVVDLPCPPLSAQGEGDLLRFTTRASFIKKNDVLYILLFLL